MLLNKMLLLLYRIQKYKNVWIYTNILIKKVCLNTNFNNC